MVISAITLAELEYGISCSGALATQNRIALNGFLAEVPVANFNANAALAYGPTRLATKERNRDALDKLIAAHAIALDVCLVTNNEADFTHYPNFSVENWVKTH